MLTARKVSKVFPMTDRATTLTFKMNKQNRMIVSDITFSYENAGMKFYQNTKMRGMLFSWLYKKTDLLTRDVMLNTITNNFMVSE